MADWYSCHISAGPYRWEIQPGDVPGDPDVLDGLTVSTNYDEDHPVQGAPQPTTLSFGVVVSALSDLADLAVGDPVNVTVYRVPPGEPYGWPTQDGPQMPLVYWLGRVSDVEATAHPSGRTLATVICTDYLADLNEITVGATDYPQETVGARFNRIGAETRLPGLNHDGFSTYGTLLAREAKAASALELLQETLADNAPWGSDYRLVVAVNAPIEVARYPGPFVPVTVDVTNNRLVSPGNPLGLVVGDTFHIYAPPGTPPTATVPITFDEPDFADTAELDPGYRGPENQFTARYEVRAIDGAGNITVDFWTGDLVTFTSPGAGVEIGREDTRIDLWHAASRPDADEPFGLAPYYKRASRGGGESASGLPGVLQLGADGWTVVIDPQPWDGVIPAAAVDLGTKWRKARSTRPDTATVISAGGKVISTERNPNPVPIEYRHDSQLTGPGTTDLARYLLPETTDDLWQIDELTVYGRGLPANHYLLWFVAYYQRYYEPSDVVIAGVDPQLHPTGRSYLVGTLLNASLTLTDASYELKLRLRPGARRARIWQPDSQATTDSLPVPIYDDTHREPFLSARWMTETPALAGITYADLDPGLTAHDLRLVRRPNAQ